MSIGTKFLALFAFLSVVLLVFIGYVVYGLQLISSSSETITDMEMPLTRGINGALLATLNGKFSLEAALSVDEFSKIAQIKDIEGDLEDSVLLFDMYISAITWGSESEAFEQSRDGGNLRQWQKLNLENNLVIREQSKEERQLAGVTNLYFGGFATNALKAISSHKEFLNLQAGGDSPASVRAAREEVRMYRNAASKFSKLAIDSLSEIVDLSNTAVIASSYDIRQIQENVRRNTFIILVVGFFISAFAGFIFVKRSIMGPLVSLTKVAQEIESGNLEVRAKIRSRDEIGMLARAFNKMTARLAEYPAELEKTVQKRTENLTRLNQTLRRINRESEKRNRELDKTAKVLVRRDMELSEVRRQREKQVNELDKAAKALVRRDMDLLRLNDELQEIDKAKTHFVSVAAHQLRTPLSIIKWTFRMLLSGDFGRISEEQKAVVQKGYDVNERMIRLISDLLNVARIESGRFSYTFKKISIEKVIRRVVKMSMPRAKERKLELAVSKVGKAKIPPIKGDEEALGVVVQNLVSNAMNYTLPGGEIEVLYKKAGDFVEVRVKDTGVGIPDNQKGRLFTKFFRGDNVVRMQTSGTGLGLFIAKSVVSAHKGKIGVESKEGKGSVFWFKLPIK